MKHRRTLFKCQQNTVGKEITICKDEINEIMMLGFMSSSLKNETMIVRYPCLLDILTQALKSTESAHIKLEIAKLLCKLAWDEDNKTAMCESEKVLEALVFLNSEKNYETKIFASTAIQYLSSAAQNKPILVEHKGGKLIDNLLVVAKDVLLQKSSLAAVQTLMHLVNRKTIPYLVSIPGFLPTLVSLSKKSLIGKIFMM